VLKGFFGIAYCIVSYHVPYTILYYTILYYTILYYAMLCYTILYYTILYYTILYYTILYYTILYYTILYYTILYYTILHYTATVLERVSLTVSQEASATRASPLRQEETKLLGPKFASRTELASRAGTTTVQNCPPAFRICMV